MYLGVRIFHWLLYSQSVKDHALYTSVFSVAPNIYGVPWAYGSSHSENVLKFIHSTYWSFPFKEQM